MQLINAINFEPFLIQSVVWCKKIPRKQSGNPEQWVQRGPGKLLTVAALKTIQSKQTPQ